MNALIFNIILVSGRLGGGVGVGVSAVNMKSPRSEMVNHMTECVPRPVRLHPLPVLKASRWERDGWRERGEPTPRAASIISVSRLVGRPVQAVNAPESSRDLFIKNISPGSAPETDHLIYRRRPPGGALHFQATKGSSAHPLKLL